MTSEAVLGRRFRGIAAVFLKLGVASASVLLVALVFEFGLRAFGFEAIYEIYSKPSALWRHDELLGWHHEPGSADVFVGPRPWPIEFETPIQINSLGLRGPEVPPREEDEIRILFLGDSMVAAFEVPYESTFPVVSAEVLASRLGRSVRAVNGGVRGYGTDQSLLYFRERGRALRPDLVVLFHSRNDLENNCTIHRMRREFGKSAFVLGASGELSLVGSPVPDYPPCSDYAIEASGSVIRRDGLVGRLLCRAQMALFDRSALLSYVTLRVRWNPNLLRSLYYLAIPGGPGSAASLRGDYPARLTRALLVELDREVRAAGARLLVIGEQTQLEELGSGELEDLGLWVVGLPPYSPEERDRYLFRRDSHYNVQGHLRVVEHIVPGLERELRGLSASAPAQNPSRITVAVDR